MLRRLAFTAVHAATKRDKLAQETMKSFQRNLRGSPRSAAARPRRYDRSAFGEGKQSRFESGPGVSQSTLLQSAGVLLGLGTVVYVSNQEAVPVSQRSHLILFPRSWEPAIGKAAVEAAIPKDAKVLPQDHPRTQSVRFIVDSLAQHIGSLEGLPAHLKDVEWTVTVVDHRMVNAMAAPGGQVLVFTGIMDLLSNRNELAAVLAHEMAHVLARHSAESVTGQLLLLPISISLALLLDTSSDVFGHVHRLMVGLPGSRANESEADLIGMHLAAHACYAPEGMVNMLRKLERLEASRGAQSTPALLRTHPLTSERVGDCRKRIPEMRQVLEASGCDLFMSQFSVPSMTSEALSSFHPPSL